MSHDITALRAHLFDAITKVKSGELDLDKARAINDISKTLVDTARVEVDYLKIAGGDESKFLSQPDDGTATPPGVTGRTVHRIR